MGEQRYFIAVFGKKHAKEHPVDGGCYPIPRSFCPPGISKGDLILLFCLKDYPKYSWKAPFLGKVTQVKEREGDVYVHYEYKSLILPKDRGSILGCLEEGEKKQLRYPRLKCYWLSEIKPTSFWCSVEGSHSDWL